MKPFITAVLSAVLLGACSGEMDHSKMPHNQEAAKTMNGVEVSGAFIKPPFTGRTTAAGFMRLDNKGPATRLISASSPISERVEIHTHLHENGVMKMRRIDGIELAQGQSVILEPGGDHLMMFDTVIPEGAQDTSLTLRYEGGAEVTLIVPLGDDAPEGNDSEGNDSGDMDHSKMGH